MITIEQLLESVDSEFEPRWIAKDNDGLICAYTEKPLQGIGSWYDGGKYIHIGHLKLSEFDGKDWTECIYEVPRKTTGKIERFTLDGFVTVVDVGNCVRSVLDSRVFDKLNALVDTINEIDENYACIAALTDIRKRLDTLEKCVKNKRGEE